MKTMTTLFCFGLLLSCSKGDLSLSTCYHHEYIIDDLGSMVSTGDFVGYRTFLCKEGTIRILADGLVIYESMTAVMGDFEMDMDLLPDAFEIRFLADPYFLHIEVVVDLDRRRTEIVEMSNLCGGHG